MFVHQKVYANFRNYGLFDFSGEDLKDTYPYFHFFSSMFFYMHGRAGPVNFKLMVKELYIHKGNLNHSNMMPL